MARIEYRRAQRLAQLADQVAAVVGAGPAGNRLASALADAYLAAPEWSRPALVDATRLVLGYTPQWTDDVVDEVLTYPRPPADRPRELARFIARLRAFRSHVAGAPGASPEATPVRVVHRVVTPTVTVRQPFHTPRLDSVADVAAWLELSIVELEWFADEREINRRARDRRLRHDTYRWLSGRLIEAPKPRLRSLQRKVLDELLGPIPVHPAAHGFVPGRSPHTFAAPHAGQHMVIRLDVMSFFASVTAARVYGLLRAAGFPEPVAHVLTGLRTTRTPPDVLRRAPARVPNRDLRLALLHGPHLPQGAPTSPWSGPSWSTRDSASTRPSRGSGAPPTGTSSPAWSSTPRRPCPGTSTTRYGLCYTTPYIPVWRSRTGTVIPTSWRTSPAESPGSANATRSGPPNSTPFSNAPSRPTPADRLLTDTCPGGWPCHRQARLPGRRRSDRHEGSRRSVSGRKPC